MSRSFKSRIAALERLEAEQEAVGATADHTRLISNFSWSSFFQSAQVGLEFALGGFHGTRREDLPDGRVAYRYIDPDPAPRIAIAAAVDRRIAGRVPTALGEWEKRTYQGGPDVPLSDILTVTAAMLQEVARYTLLTVGDRVLFWKGMTWLCLGYGSVEAYIHEFMCPIDPPPTREGRRAQGRLTLTGGIFALLRPYLAVEAAYDAEHNLDPITTSVLEDTDDGDSD